MEKIYTKVFLYHFIFIETGICPTGRVADFDKLNLVKLGCIRLVFGSSQFFSTAPVASKMMLTTRVVKYDFKIIISLIKYKSVIHFIN
jgi:hypothetical protein